MDKRHGKRAQRTWRRVKSENTHRFTKNNTKKKYQFWKHLAMMECMDSGSKNSLPSMTFILITSQLSKWIDAYKKQTYLNGWPKKWPHWSRKAPYKKPFQTTTDP